MRQNIALEVRAHLGRLFLVGMLVLAGCQKTSTVGIPGAGTSAGDTTPPTAPAGLAATAASFTEIDLSWTAATDDVAVAAYRLESCAGAGCSNFVQIAAPTGTSFANTGLGGSTSYSYRVRAVDEAGNPGAYSAVATASTPAAPPPPDTTPPSAPAGLTATAASSSEIDLGWSAATDNVGVTGYSLESCAGASCSSFTPVATPTGTSFNNTGLAAATSYSYRVRAMDAAGNLGNYSGIATASTNAAPPPPPDTTPPSAPSGLSATTASSTQINLAWTAATDNVGVTGYRLESCAGAGCSNFSQIAAPAGTSFGNTGLAPGTSYSYRVRATDAAGNLGSYSNVATASTPDTTPPGAPSNLSATASSQTQINLAWTAATDNVGVTGYRVESCSGAGCSNFVQIAAPAGTSFGNTGLSAGTSYSYRVRAVDAAGNLGGYSGVATAATPDTTPPSAPANLAAIAFSQTQINLSWAAATDNVGVTGYRVESCSGAGCSNFAQIATPTGTSLSNTGLAAATSYSYRVRAVDAAGNVGGYSNIATASTTDTTPPSAPANLTATASSQSQVNLGWTAATDNVGVTGYRVESCSGIGCSNFAQIGTPTSNSFSNTGLAAATSYSYRVRAADAAGNLGTYSNVATASTPDTAPPSTPANLTATPVSPTQINLAWAAATDNVGVTAYHLESCAGASCSNFTEIAAQPGTSFSNTGLTASTSYSYRVRAADAAGNLGSYSTVATASTPSITPISVSISPRRGGLTVTQTLTLTAAVTNDVGAAGVTWTASAGNLSGMTSTSATFSSLVAGSVTVTATSVADSSKSASATLGVTDLPGVFTHHNDSQRTGANAQEYAISPSNLSSSTFGKLFACALDAPGYVYAQPLYVANLTMGDGKTHNVLFVATESDWVYAFDADSNACQQFWKTRVLETGETTVPPADTNETGDLVPEIGVTSTPVIDPATGTLYVCAKAKDASSNYHHRLYALDLVSGARKLGSPVEITAPNFVALFHLQRPALLLDNGTVYIAFGSHGDNNTYQGWLMAYNASTLAQKFVWSSTDPTSGNNQGAIWQAGNGPSVDSLGNVYVETANGVFDADGGGINYSDSVVKLSPSGTVLDYFTPFDQSTLSTNDIDLGSSGTIVLPDALGSTAHPHLALATGKPGTLYLLDRDTGKLGQFHLSGDQNVQEVAVVPFNETNITGGIFGQPAVWNGNVYVAAVGDFLRQFGIASGALSLVSQSQSANTFGLRGATPVVSASGTTNGIVWALDISAYPSGAAVLNAYSAGNLATRLYASPASGTGAAGKAVKFTVPTVANGKVYVGGQASITVFGLLP